MLDIYIPEKVSFFAKYALSVIIRSWHDFYYVSGPRLKATTPGVTPHCGKALTSGEIWYSIEPANSMTWNNNLEKTIDLGDRLQKLFRINLLFSFFTFFGAGDS